MITAGEGGKQVTAKLPGDSRTWLMTGFAKTRFLFQAYETQQVFNFPGFWLFWVLPEVVRWPTTSTKGQVQQQLVLIPKGMAQAFKCAWWWGECLWGHTELGQGWAWGDTSAAATHQHCASTHIMQPWQRLSQKIQWKSSGGWQKWRMLKLEQREGGRELVLFQSR